MLGARRAREAGQLNTYKGPGQVNGDPVQSLSRTYFPAIMLAFSAEVPSEKRHTHGKCLARPDQLQRDARPKNRAGRTMFRGDPGDGPMVCVSRLTFPSACYLRVSTVKEVQ